MNLHEIKDEKERKVSELISACLMFFAFSDKQFEENKTPLQEGEKYVSIGAGGYLPKGKVPEFTQGIKDIDLWYETAIKENDLRKAHIAYELANHEAYYTGDIEDTAAALGPDYTNEEIWAVFNENYEEQMLNF